MKVSWMSVHDEECVPSHLRALHSPYWWPEPLCDPYVIGRSGCGLSYLLLLTESAVSSSLLVTIGCNVMRLYY